MEQHGIFADLLNVEVNTIIKHSMTAEKMPSLPFALLDIIEGYGRELARLGVDLDAYFSLSRPACWDKIKTSMDEPEDGGKPEGERYLKVCREHYQVAKGKQAPQDDPFELFDFLNDMWPAVGGRDENTRKYKPRPLKPEPTSFSMERVANGWDTFERLRIAGQEAVSQLPEGSDKVMVTRIIGACARLKYVVQGLQQKPPPPQAAVGDWLRSEAEGETYAKFEDLIPKTRNELLRGEQRYKRIPTLLRSEDFALVRKMWEVGTERVLVQTCVQIDGDVLTRISEQLFDEKLLPNRDAILAAHKRSVDTGLSHWRSLVQVAVELVELLLKPASGGGKRFRR